MFRSPWCRSGQELLIQTEKMSVKRKDQGRAGPLQKMSLPFLFLFPATISDLPFLELYATEKTKTASKNVQARQKPKKIERNRYQHKLFIAWSRTAPVTNKCYMAKKRGIWYSPRPYLPVLVQNPLRQPLPKKAKTVTKWLHEQ